MKSNRKLFLSLLVLFALQTAGLFGQRVKARKPSVESLQEKTIGVSVNPADGSYSVFDPVSRKVMLHSRVAVEIDHHWTSTSDYPQHATSRDRTTDDLGSGTQLTVSNTGLRSQPDLIYSLRTHSDPDYVTVTVRIHNSGPNPVTVRALRSVTANGPPVVDLGGPDVSTRILSDSFSEDRPGIVIHDLADAENGMHRAVGSQPIYNRETKRNLFLGALTSEKFLTILRLHISKDKISSYEVDSAGTTELLKENSLKRSSSEDQIELSLPVAPNADLSSEPLLISTGSDYHHQLEDYGGIIRKLHHARVTAPSFAGWWSWTAYYFGLNQGTALTNAQWLSDNLKDLGYTFFHIDEGYQYARGEYTTPDATLFPGGMNLLESKVRALGLTPGIWTAPFEVSERSWLYETTRTGSFTMCREFPFMPAGSSRTPGSTSSIYSTPPTRARRTISGRPTQLSQRIGEFATLSSISWTTARSRVLITSRTPRLSKPSALGSGLFGTPSEKMSCSTRMAAPC